MDFIVVPATIFYLVWDLIQNPDEWKADWDSWFKWKEEKKVQGRVVTGTFSTLFRPGLVKDFQAAYYPGKLWFVEDRTGVSDTIVGQPTPQLDLDLKKPD